MKTTALFSFLVLQVCAGGPALENTAWRLVSEDTKATIRFADGRMAVKVCNQMSGTYRVEGTKLVIKTGPSTMMACAPEVMTVEKNLYELLGSNPNFKVEGDTLTLSNPDGQWKFEREAQTPKK